MTEFIHTQNSFANGEIAPEFYLTKNINGLSRLENMDVLSGGGLTRRPGLIDIATISGRARIFSFDISDAGNYVLVFYNYAIQIYSNDTLITTLISPWSESMLAKLQFAGRGDSVIFVHPDVSPYVLQKSGNTFALSKFSFFDTTNTYSRMPFMKYDAMHGVSISVSAGPYGVKSATFTASQNYWQSSNVGTLVSFDNQIWEITEFVRPIRFQIGTKVHLIIITAGHLQLLFTRTDWYSVEPMQPRAEYGCRVLVIIIILMSERV